MGLNKTTLAAGLAVAATLGSAGQATAGIYAGSRLLVDEFSISFNPFIPGTDPVIGNFDFGTTSTAGLVPGGGDASIASCIGNVAAGTTSCGAGGAATPVLYTGTVGTIVGDGPADVNGGRADFGMPLNTAPYLGPTGAVNYASSDAIVDSAQLVGAINAAPAFTASRQIAEVEIDPATSALANTDISSTTSFTYLFSIGGTGDLTLNFSANPDLLAQFDDATATDATATANLQTTFVLTSSDAAGGPISVRWTPTFATGGCTDGAVDTNLSLSGVTCAAETVAENLNGSVTAPGPLPTSTDDFSREAGTNGGVALTGPADMGFQQYSLVLTGLTAGNFAFGLNGKTAANVTRIQVPEPSTLLLLGTGLALCGVGARRQKKHRA